MFDWKPILDLLFGFVDIAATTAITILVPFAIRWILTKLKVDKLTAEAIMREYVYVALDKAIAIGRDKARKALGTIDTTIEVENKILEFALVYAQQAVPGALNDLGITQQKLAELLRARLAEAGITEGGDVVVTSTRK